MRIPTSTRHESSIRATVRFGRHASGACAAFAILAGCGGPQEQIAPPSGMTPYAVGKGAAIDQRGRERDSCAAAGCLYVANSQGGPFGTGIITAYAANANGNARPIARIAGGMTDLNNPSGVALDDRRNIYVTDLSGNYQILVYASGSHGDVAPKDIILGTPSDPMMQPTDVALDAAANIYVSAFTSRSISVYAPGSNGSPAPIQYIAGKRTRLRGPGSLAVSQNGTTYVANFLGDSVTIYAPGSTGNVAPIRKIVGAKTNLHQCTGVALDGTGNIYVANATLPSGLPGVTVYAKRANGDVAPIRTISGSSTGLTAPNGIALDSGGNIYVANYQSGGGSVTVYAKGAKGNVAPLRTITGSHTLLDAPGGMTVQ